MNHFISTITNYTQHIDIFYLGETHSKKILSQQQYSLIKQFDGVSEFADQISQFLNQSCFSDYLVSI